MIGLYDRYPIFMMRLPRPTNNRINQKIFMEFIFISQKEIRFLNLGYRILNEFAIFQKVALSAQIFKKNMILSRVFLLVISVN